MWKGFLQHIEGLLLEFPEHRQCFAKVVRRDAGLLLWIAFDILVDAEASRDCVIDALTKAARSLQRRPIGDVHNMDLKQWSCACVYKRAQTMRRLNSRLKTVSLQEAAASVGSESVLWYPQASTQVILNALRVGRITF